MSIVFSHPVGMSGENLTNSIPYIEDPFEVVTEEKSIQVLFDFPLQRKEVITLFPLYGSEKFTRIGIAKAISIKYQQIYEEENKSSGTVLYKQGGVLYRRESNGKWGIGKYPLSSLFLKEILCNDGVCTLLFSKM